MTGWVSPEMDQSSEINSVNLKDHTMFFTLAFPKGNRNILLLLCVYWMLCWTHLGQCIQYLGFFFKKSTNTLKHSAQNRAMLHSFNRSSLGRVILDLEPILGTPCTRCEHTLDIIPTFSHLEVIECIQSTYWHVFGKYKETGEPLYRKITDTKRTWDAPHKQQPKL